MKHTTSGTRKKETTFPSDDPRALMAQQAGSAAKLNKGPGGVERAVLLQQRKRRAEQIRGTFRLV